MQFKITTIVTIQIVHLTMLSFQGNELQYHFLEYTCNVLEFALESYWTFLPFFLQLFYVLVFCFGALCAKLRFHWLWMHVDVCVLNKSKCVSFCFFFSQQWNMLGIGCCLLYFSFFCKKFDFAMFFLFFSHVMLLNLDLFETLSYSILLCQFHMDIGILDYFEIYQTYV